MANIGSLDSTNNNVPQPLLSPTANMTSRSPYAIISPHGKGVRTTSIENGPGGVGRIHQQI